MKTLVIDIDGVACEHAKAICERVNREFALNSVVDDVKTWDHNFGPISFNEAVDKYYSDSTFILSMEVSPGLKEFIYELGKSIKVILATTRKHSHEATKEWVAKFLGNDIKLKFVKKKVDLKPDAVIDDHHEEVISVAQMGGIGFLFVRPWNDNKNIVDKFSAYDNIHLVKNFAEVNSKLRRYNLLN